MKERITYEYRGYTFLNYVRFGEFNKLKKLLSSIIPPNTCYQTQTNTNYGSPDSMLNSTSPLSHSAFLNYSYRVSSSSENCLTDKSNCNLSSPNNCTISHTPLFINSPSDLIYFKNTANGYGPLHYAVESAPTVSSKTRKQIIDFLIKKKALINEKSNEGFTPLVLALEKKDLEIAECLLKNKASTDILDKSGLNPLHRMAQKNDLPAVQLLLTYDADINALTSQGFSVEQIAAEPIKKFIMNYKLINNNPEFKLLEASKNGDLVTVRTIIEVEPQLVNCRDLDGRQSTPLHFAAGYNHPEIVKFLLDNGADIHAKDKGGLVPLHNACSYGHFEIAELLIKYGANVNVTDYWKYSPLHEGN